MKHNYLEKMNEEESILLAKKQTKSLFYRKCNDEKYYNIVSRIVYFDQDHHHVDSDLYVENEIKLSTSINIYPKIDFILFKIDNYDTIGYKLNCRG